MAKKKSANDFNMSQAISEILKANRKATNQEALAALVAKHPSAKINKNSFSVAFYTGRKKLGIGSPGRKKKGVKRAKANSTARLSMDMYALQTAAKFLSEIGGADAALEAIKQVQTLQVK